MKQTALDIFFSKLGMHEQWVMQHDYEQAKEMEWKQTIEFGYACTNQIDMNDNGELLMVKSPKELYNEKYGGKNAE